MVCLKQNHSRFKDHFLVKSMIAFIGTGPSVSAGYEETKFFRQAVFQADARFQRIQACGDSLIFLSSDSMW